MKSTDRNVAMSNSMLNFLQQAGMNQNDRRARNALRKFKTPPYYLVCGYKTNIKNKEKEN